MRVAFNKSLVEVQEVKEDLHIIDALQSQLVSNHFNLVQVYLDTLLAYNEVKEVKLQVYKLALLNVGI